MKLNIYCISYPPYAFRITEIKYIYLTPILHTYTSHSIRRHTLYTSSTQPIRVYAYCVDTHWHAAHYSPPTFDRPRSKRGDSSETNQRWRSSRQKKKNLQLSHSVFKQTNIERLLVTSNITTARKCWQFAVGYSKLKTVVGTGGQSSPGFDQQAASVLWWILNNPPSTRRTHKYVGVNDMMTEYYEISHSSIQSEEILYPTHWDIPAIRRAFELFIDFNRRFFQ